MAEEDRTPEKPEQSEEGIQDEQEQSVADLGSLGFSNEDDSNEHSEQPEQDADEQPEKQDSKAESEDSEDAQEQQNQVEESEKPKLYTSDELEQVVEEKGWDGIDPERLSEEGKKSYKLMQRAFTRKAQHMSEEISELSKKKADLEGITKGVDIEPNEEEQIYAQTVDEVKKRFGEKFDEYDPKIQAAINERYTRNASDVRYNKAVNAKIKQEQQQLRSEEPYFDKIDQVAEHILKNEYSGNDRDKVLKALSFGNTAPARKIFEDARKRFYANLKKQQQTQTPQPNVFGQEQPQARKTKQKAQPPVTESGGQGKQSQSKKADDILEIMGFT